MVEKLSLYKSNFSNQLASMEMLDRDITAYLDMGNGKGASMSRDGTLNLFLGEK